MKARWRTAIAAVAVIGILAIFRIWVLKPDRNAMELALRAREDLRKEGFRLTFEEFDLVPAPAEAARAARLQNILAATQRARALRRVGLATMRTVEPGSARAAWQQKPLKSEDSADLWPEALASLEEHRHSFQELSRIILDGPVRFPVLQPSGILQLSNLEDIRTTSCLLAGAVATHLHYSRIPEAWTNLLALTVLATQWKPEPTSISLTSRFQVQAMAFATLWEALQAREWTDAQLAVLQEHWSRLDPWYSIPDTAALERAEALRVCELSRAETALPVWATAAEFGQACLQQWHSPSAITAWTRNKFRAWRATVRYQRQTSYQDEATIAYHYREKERELSAALSSRSWLELRRLRVAGPTIPFKESAANSRLAESEPTATDSASVTDPSPGSLISRAACAESSRRIALFALALERLHLRTGTFPKTLEGIPAELRPALESVDFMDERPLRYRLEGDSYLLYSVGFDAVDDGGDAHRTTEGRSGLRLPRDIVWPRAATAEELAAYEARNERARFPWRFLQDPRRPDPSSTPPPEVLRRLGILPRPTATP